MSSNQLANASSPYLRLHADNPVDWKFWDAAVFAEAQAQNKPVLLSIGYTACHWCHVMNQESFADAETAELMNKHFITIKLDREERPDLDHLYQTSAQAMGHQGGWPLTIFLTPQGEPFFSGTYFPKDDQPNMPAFKRVLEDVAKIYGEQPDAVAQNATRVREALNNVWGRDMRAELDVMILDLSAIHTAQRFDIFYGGMTGAPKFPQAGLIDVLWRAYLRSNAPQFYQLVQTTLDHICMGGIYDHVGGGFARYTTDERWLLPHFEKMLYDNAQLVEVLTSVWQHNRNPLYRERIEETIAFILRDMQVEGGFASSLDADSEGEEGKYYLWTEAEIDAALAGTFSQRFKQIYNIRQEGTWQGKNILHRMGGGTYPMPEADEALFKRQRELLREARSRRVAPLRDDKILADWNGMMIAALAKAGAAFENRHWIDAARGAFEVVQRRLGDGTKLYHSWCAGQRNVAGFADDYAHMARAALVLWEVTQEPSYLESARQWTEELNTHFWTSDVGGYCQTSDEGEALFVRPRTIFDQPMPAANGVMMQVLAKLHTITTEQAFGERAHALVQAFAAELGRSFLSMGSYLNALETIMTGLQVVIIGPRNAAKTQDLIAAYHGRCVPHGTLIVVEPDQSLPEQHPARSKTMHNGQPTAYICMRNSCSVAIDNAVTLSQHLQLPPRAANAQ